MPFKSAELQGRRCSRSTQRVPAGNPTVRGVLEWDPVVSCRKIQAVFDAHGYRNSAGGSGHGVVVQECSRRRHSSTSLE